MRIEILAASNLDPRYLDCVVPFIKFTQTLKSTLPGVEFVPRIIVVADTIPPQLEPYSEFIETYPASLPSGFVAQNIRTLSASLSEADAVITTDIDMMPLTSKVFDSGLSTLLANPRVFIILRDVLPPSQYPICYSLASPAVFQEVTGVSNAIECDRRLTSMWKNTHEGPGYDGKRGGAGWFSDQKELYELVQGFAHAHPQRVVYFTDSMTGHKRLDREDKRGKLRWFRLALVFLGLLTDYHVHHPIWNHRHFVNAVYRASRKTIRGCVPKPAG